MFEDWRERNRSFEHLAAYSRSPVNLTGAAIRRLNSAKNNLRVYCCAVFWLCSGDELRAGMQNLSLSRDEMERRRLAAAQDLLNGGSQASVARKFGVSRTTASRWCKALDGKDMTNLRKRRATGRPCRLTPLQRAEIVEMFAAGPQAMGFAADRWTTVRLAEAIERRFGVRYDPDHVGRLMHRLGLRKRERGNRSAGGLRGVAVFAEYQFQPVGDLAHGAVSSRGFQDERDQVLRPASGLFQAVQF